MPMHGVATWLVLLVVCSAFATTYIFIRTAYPLHSVSAEMRDVYSPIAARGGAPGGVEPGHELSTQPPTTGVEEEWDFPTMPRFVLIGTQKAATTFMKNVLFTHPRLRTVCRGPTTTGEGSFLLQGHKFKDAEAFRKAYGSALLESTNKCRDVGDIIFDNKPAYMAEAKSKTIAFLVQAVPQQTFFVLNLRDPLERMVSAMSMMSCHVGKERNMCQLTRWNATMTTLDTKSQHIYKGFYGKALKKWLQYVPRERILIFYYEEILREPLRVMNEILSRAHLQNLSRVPDVNSKPDWQTKCKVKQCGTPARDQIKAAAYDRCPSIRRCFDHEIRDLSSIVGKSVPASWFTCGH
mmetsp:Transcript_19187/g.60359  ORF Transcript_19187/g.60359 Transcript_19187/m.60359 type:complete len:351 (-) Transcript_19187:28-1080(-)